MRCDQFFGLPPAAIDFLKKHEVSREVCTHCERPFPRVLKIISYYVGMFGDHYPYYRHQLKDESVADEYVQSEAWSSGPCFFLGLKVSNGQTFEWPQSEIDNA